MIKHLKRQYTIIRVFYVMACILAFIGFFMCIGGIGSIDLATEEHRVLTHNEEMTYYMTSVIGIVTFGASIWLAEGLARSSRAILKQIRKIKRHRRQMQIDADKNNSNL